MKKILIVTVLMAAVQLNPNAVYSEEKVTGLPDVYDQYKTYELNGNKDQCLIVAINCRGGNDTVLNRVERLNKEIEKGSSVYTLEELQNFRDQLNWIYYESEEFPQVRM